MIFDLVLCVLFFGGIWLLSKSFEKTYQYVIDNYDHINEIFFTKKENEQ